MRSNAGCTGFCTPTSTSGTRETVAKGMLTARRLANKLDGMDRDRLFKELLLSADRLDQLGEALLDFNSPADLDAWLQSHR